MPSAVASTPAPTVSRPAPAAPLQPDASPSKPRARVNLDELAAQVKGNNQALRLLSAELDEKKTWDAAQLATAIETLEPLVIRKDDLTMACDLLSPDELSRVGRPDSPAAVIADVAAKISAAQKRIEKGEFSGTQSQRQTELEMLDALSRKLKAIVFDHP
ncbi:MAG: hypothetical protein NTW96_11220 [Planctomycetia bacterium]|nr:hypothetical protein [Planctomycetia bacterium]